MMVDRVLRAVREVVHEGLSGNIMTLGELINTLESLDSDKQIIFVYPDDPSGELDYDYKKYDDETVGLGSFDSYRGYYQYLSIRPSEKIVTVGEVLAELKNAVGETFEGYKGGDFTMNRETYVWCSHYGHASTLKIVRAAMNHSSGFVCLFTAFESDDDYDEEEVDRRIHSY